MPILHDRARAAAMRLLLSVALLFVAASAFETGGIVPAALAADRNDHLSERDLTDLDRVSKYLNGIKTMQGRFFQVSDQGLGGGQFWMRKPGRLRFVYDPPATIELVADGTVVAVIDKQLETVNTYPLSATPLKVILARKIDLADDVDIISVERRDDRLFITAREDEGVAAGQITLIHEEPTLALRQWVIIDAQGVETTITLKDVKEGMKLPRSLFRFEQPDGWDE
ncbi:MAG: outer membrane lipoprotein carrier protein LolA [Alphaproteobacteria bacterium]